MKKTKFEIEWIEDENNPQSEIDKDIKRIASINDVLINIWDFNQFLRNKLKYKGDELSEESYKLLSDISYYFNEIFYEQLKD